MKLIQKGPRSSRVMIVGEAPGATEMARGQPFVGASGELLDRMLGRAGITPSECFFTNICHIQPQGAKLNDFNWFLTPEGRTHLLVGMLQLQKDLFDIRPNLVFALGAQPLRVLTSKAGIDKYRGSILAATPPFPPVKVIGTYHPAYILRSWDYKAVAEMDLSRCKEDAKFPELRLPERELLLHPNRDVRNRVIPEMLQAEWLAVDIECWEKEDGSWSLACCGFSDRANRALTIHNYSPEDLADIALLCGSSVPKVFQNGQFDVTVLEQQSGIKVNGWGEKNSDGVSAVGWDTMLAQHALYPECASSTDDFSSGLKGSKRVNSALRKGLGFLTSINTREPFYKDDGKLWKETNDLQMFWRYNALDAAVTREIRDVQETDLNNFRNFGTFQRKMRAVRVLMDTTRTGILVDVGERQRMKKEVETEIARLQLFLNAGAGKPVNVSSSGVNGDVGKLLYQQLGLPVKLNRETNNPTADKDAIIELAEKYGHPLLLTILSIRERRKVVETYLDSRLSPDGRIRCSYDLTGTRTHRLASRASIDGTGQNLQNQPDKIKRVFVSDSGRVFISPDYSQAEARVVAYLSREQELIELFEDPSRDVHKENASRIFGIPVPQVGYEMRFTAKRGIHSANYGVGPDKTMKVINQDAKDTWGKPGTGITVNLSTAKRVVEGYFLLYPGVKSCFWRDVVDQLKRDRTLTGVFGSRRTFFGRWEGADDSKFLNAAYSYIPQNAVGELCVTAMERIDEHVRETRVLGNVHDSILSDCVDDPDTVERVISQMASHMRVPLTIHGRTFYIPTEFKVGYVWGNRGKDGSNPLGLVDAEEWLDSRRKNGPRAKLA